MASKVAKKPSVDSNTGILAFLCYLLWPVGVVLLLLEKTESDLRFHAWNGIGLGLAWWIIAWVVGMFLWFLWPLTQLIWLAGLIYAIVLGIKAYNGEKPEIPVVTGLVRQNVKGI